MKEISISGKNYKIKQTIRAIFLFEQIIGRVFEIKNTMDNYIYFYCILLANNKEDCLTFDEFIDALDEDPNILVELNKKLTESQEIEKILNPDNDNESEDKKKE